MIGGGQFVAAAVLKGTILPKELQAKRDEHGRREEDQRDEGGEESAWEGHASSILSRLCQGCVKGILAENALTVAAR